VRKNYTVARVAAKLKCHPNTLKRIEKRLKLPIKRDYRNYRIYTDEIIAKIRAYINIER
jgi:DNA-binding transcriptional MerR regulator